VPLDSAMQFDLRRCEHLEYSLAPISSKRGDKDSIFSLTHQSNYRLYLLNESFQRRHGELFGMDSTGLHGVMAMEPNSDHSKTSQHTLSSMTIAWRSPIKYGLTENERHYLRRHCLRRYVFEDKIFVFEDKIFVFEDFIFEDKIFVFEDNEDKIFVFEDDEDIIFRRMPGRSRNAGIKFSARAITKNYTLINVIILETVH
jgi:hypothetical protein